MSIQPNTGKLARALQVVLALEVTILVIGLGMACLRGWITPHTWLLGAAGWWLGSRALAVGNNFIKTQWHRSPRVPEHQIGLLGTLRLLWGEYYTTLVVYSFLFPFEAWLVPQAPKAAVEGKGMPIVLVPGFCCNRGYWALFARRLRQAGLGPVYAVSLEPLFGSIEDNAAALAREVSAALAASQSKQVILLGHSMGGLVIRQYLHSGHAHHVAHAICLGSPHHGTVIANGLASLGTDLKQMSLGSRWATEFNQNESAPCPAPITNIVTPHDNIVAPQESCLLHYPNSRNITLPGIGHLEMVLSGPVFECVVSVLRDRGNA